MRRRILCVPALLLSCLMVFAACEEEAFNAAYDEDDIRELAYRALYHDLRIDTLGCAAMAVTVGDSLREGLFWPLSVQGHSYAFLARLDDLPIRILHMSGLAVDTVAPPGWGLLWRTRDTEEVATACFTGSIERIDATHLVLICGMFFRSTRQAYAACNVVHENGTWKAGSLKYYYRLMEDR